MKPILELQRLAASKLPEILKLNQSGQVDPTPVWWIKGQTISGYGASQGTPVLDTEWPYIVQELLEPMMKGKQILDYTRALLIETGCSDILGIGPHGETIVSGIACFNLAHATTQQRLTAMDEINFFDTQK